jgi:hypothetical protein
LGKQKRHTAKRYKKRHCKTSAEATKFAPQQLGQPNEFVHMWRRLRCSTALSRAQGSEGGGALCTRTRLPPVFKQLKKTLEVWR